MPIDLTLFVLLALLGGVGLARGFIKQIWSLAVLIGLLILKPWNHAPLASLFQGIIPGDLPGASALRALVGFIALYLILSVAGWLVEKFLIRKMPLVNEGDRVMGLVLGLTKGALLGLLMVWCLETAMMKGASLDGEPAPVLSRSVAVRVLGGTNPWKVSQLRRILSQSAALTPDQSPSPRAIRLATLTDLDALADLHHSERGNWPRWVLTLSNKELRAILGDRDISQVLLAKAPTPP